MHKMDDQSLKHETFKSTFNNALFMAIYCLNYNTNHVVELRKYGDFNALYYVLYGRKEKGNVKHNCLIFQVVLCCCSLASSLTKAEETLEIDDGYGSPAAPVLTSYQQPESYTLPVKVKKSVVSNEIEDEIDGYGSPAAPVLGSSQLPSYSPAGPPPVPSRYPKRRPNRPLYRRKPKFNWLHYMPMMNLLMLASSRKPKRHILPYQGKPVTNRHVRMPSFRFRMPQFRTPSPLKFLTSTPTFATKKPTKYYKKPSKGHIKLEYSGWKPIEISQYSPQAPSQGKALSSFDFRNLLNMASLFRVFRAGNHNH